MGLNLSIPEKVSKWYRVELITIWTPLKTRREAHILL